MRLSQRIKNLYHLIVAVIANFYYGFPSRKLKVIGVTGTDGKTTTTHLIYHILNGCGKKVSMISSIFAKIAGEEYSIGFHVTTPNSFAIQKFIRQAVDHGDEYIVLEVTSHALDQFRVWGIKYEVGVITNITHEHLDYHRTFEDYVKAKVKLFLNSKLSVVNEDDKSFNLIKNQISNLCFSSCEGEVDRQANIKYQKYNSKFKVLNQLQPLTKYNQYNYSAAYTVCKYLGLGDSNILDAMKSFQLPKGRLETVYDKEFKIIIDFAHTPNALNSVLSAIKKNQLKKDGRLIHVFGAAGLRDKFKRPLMGEVSSKYSDSIILTEEDYRTENLEKICQEIAKGIKNSNYSVISDREKAIEKAISLAQKNDVIVLTGKSHEKSLCRGKTEYPWDEFEAVKRALKISNF